jgi:GT2 family glycosyltransferase
MISPNEYLVTALVPTYRAERFMRGLLEDLESQTLAPRLEIVIVDTNSSQYERTIVEEFQRRYDNIVYLRTAEWENSHGAINRCIRLARGKYLTLACTDDRHKPDAFERMVAVLEARPEIALVYANCYITLTENETFLNHHRVERCRWADFDPLKLLYGCYIGPQPMWRRHVHERYGYLDESLKSAGDWDFWLRLSEGETFLHIDEYLGLYLYSPTSSEHKDPELSRQEAELVHQRYIHREAALKERQSQARLQLPAPSGILVLVTRGTDSKQQVEDCVEQLRRLIPPSGNLSIRTVRAHSGIPENDLDVTISPGSPTASEALSLSIPWEARYVLLISPEVHLTQSCLDKLIAVADSEGSIAMVGPVSNKGPLLQRGEKVLGDAGNQLQTVADQRAARYGNQWEEAPCLAGFCVLLKSEAIGQVGEWEHDLPLTEALWSLYLRVRTNGFKLACSLGAYVHRAGLGQEEGIGDDDLADGERLFHLGDIEGARMVFEKSLQTDPNNVEVLNNLGVIAFQQGEIRRATSYFARVLEIDENHVDATGNLGKCMVARRSYGEALKRFQRALGLRPDDVDLLNSLGNCLIRTDDFKGAEKVYTQSYRLNCSQAHVGEILAELEKLKALAVC